MVPTFIGPLTLKKHPEEQKKMASSRSLLLLQLPASASAVVAPPMQRLPWATISILPFLLSYADGASEISLSSLGEKEALQNLLSQIWRCVLYYVFYVVCHRSSFWCLLRLRISCWCRETFWGLIWEWPRSPLLPPKLSLFLCNVIK